MKYATYLNIHTTAFDNKPFVVPGQVWTTYHYSQCKKRKRSQAIRILNWKINLFSLRPILFLCDIFFALLTLCSYALLCPSLLTSFLKTQNSTGNRIVLSELEEMLLLCLIKFNHNMEIVAEPLVDRRLCIGSILCFEKACPLSCSVLGERL